MYYTEDTMNKELLQQALDALLEYDEDTRWAGIPETRAKGLVVIKALEEAIVQPEQEPVAWLRDDGTKAMGYAEGFNDACSKPTIEMTIIAQHKLDHLTQQGYTINGYAIERSNERALITVDGKVYWLNDDKPFSVTDLQTQFPALACALALWQLAPRNEHPASWNAFLLVETELEKILNFCLHQRK